MANLQVPGVAAGPVPPAVSTEPPGAGGIPFTQAAAPPRTQISYPTSLRGLTAASQPEINTIPGTGYMVWLDNFITVAPSGTGNSSTTSVALAQDAPWSALSSITLDDGTAQIINVDGYAQYLLNIYGGGWFMRDYALSADANVHASLSTGTGTAAGTGSFHIRIPFAINERNYAGLLGNQDRGTKYNLRTDLAGSAAIYGTAPSVLPTVTITRALCYLPVPGPASSDGRAQEQMPANYGVIHYMTSVRSDALPAASSVVNHYIRNLANAVRLFILVFRFNNSRTSAESNMPTQVDFVLGTDTVWSESTQTRRQIMFSRYGFDAPSGVLVYDCVRDFCPVAGCEIGDQWVYLGNISEAQFRITYPSGAGVTNNSLQIITDSLFIPPGVPVT